MPGGAGSVLTVEVGEDLLDDHRIIDTGDDLDAAAASPTGLDVDVRPSMKNNSIVESWPVKLLEFPHSRSCEKARWALDYKRVVYDRVAIMPGFHIATLRMLARETSVPLLLTGNGAIQGSSEIINFLDEQFPERPLTPIDNEQRHSCLAIEHSMDENIGENLRRVLYDRLLAYPDFIRHCFAHSMSKSKQLIFVSFYPILRAMIYRRYVISTARVEQAKLEFDDAMRDLEQRLAHQPYLRGAQFSRADLSVASMLSLLIMPAEHPFPWQDIPDPNIKIFYAQYQDHPMSKWERDIYRKHRL